MSREMPNVQCPMMQCSIKPWVYRPYPKNVDLVQRVSYIKLVNRLLTGATLSFSGIFQEKNVKNLAATLFLFPNNHISCKNAKFRLWRKVIFRKPLLLKRLGLVGAPLSLLICIYSKQWQCNSVLKPIQTGRWSLKICSGTVRWTKRLKKFKVFAATGYCRSQQICTLVWTSLM